MSVTTASLVLVMLMKFVELFPGCSSSILSHYLHPGSGISAELDPMEFSESTACWATVFHLAEAGVDEIQICEVMPIEAPLSGYLVDATGYWDSGSGRIMKVFRVGIHDDREQYFIGGEKFVFLAAGFTDSGEVFLYPEAVLTEDSVPSFVYEHEFLVKRDKFFSLPERFRN
ncbi:MAG: hypothetical protein KAH54_03240 [Candidatus Sabulitectum sp.]|nr:hypothetical protein [Candidatus Sabulitectum sp.]